MRGRLAIFQKFGVDPFFCSQPECVLFGPFHCRRQIFSIFASFALMGLWESSMRTFALTLASVGLSLAIGLPLGVLADFGAGDDLPGLELLPFVGGNAVGSGFGGQGGEEGESERQRHRSRILPGRNGGVNNVGVQAGLTYTFGGP